MALEDRVTEYANRYTMTDEDGNESTIYLEKDEGEITTEGTALNADTLTEAMSETIEDLMGGASFDEAGNLSCSNIKYGQVSITCKKADTTYSKSVTFDEAFSGTPYIFVTVVSSYPQYITQCTVANRASTGFTVKMIRSKGTSDANTVCWLAIRSS